MASKVLFSLLALLVCAQATLAINIITKAQWGGRPATSVTTLNNGLPYAIIHHTAGNYCSTQAACINEVRGIQNYHQWTLGWHDIGYHFLIGGDGNIYEGAGWNRVGAHAYNWNFNSIGISFMGNYNNSRPTAAQINAAKALLAEAVRRGQIKSGYVLYGHRQVSATECPGTNLWNEIRNWPAWRA